MKMVVARISPVISPNPTPPLIPSLLKLIKRSGQIACQQSQSQSQSNHQDQTFPPLVFKRSNFKNKKTPSAIASDIPYIPSTSTDYSNLQTEFEGNGVTFEEISIYGATGETLVLTMTLQNGSTVVLMLPDALITSYKAPMRHGGKVELLHTYVSQHAKSTEVKVNGGVSAAFNCQIGMNGSVSTWSPSIWDLSSIKRGEDDDEDFIKIELKSSNWDKTVEAKYILTLTEDALTSNVIFSNKSSSYIRVMGSVISHLGVSTPDATYALGLEGSHFYSRPPLSSTFCITPNKWRQAESVDEDEDEEEDDNYKQLTEEMSRIYTNAPSRLTIMDRGKRNSVIVGREGFEEFYLFSPGSDQEWYGKHAFICVGQSALLRPVILAPGDKWKGTQHLHNPNM